MSAQEGEPRGIRPTEQKAGGFIEHIQDTPEISETLQQAGIRVQPANPPISGFDPQGMAITNNGQTVTTDITLPGDETFETLKEKSKGNPVFALTWWAAMWLRGLKIAWHNGRKVLGKQPSQPQSV